MKITIYRLSDGLILRTGECPPEYADLQCGEGEAIYPDCPPGATHIIDHQPLTLTE